MRAVAFLFISTILTSMLVAYYFRHGTCRREGFVDSAGAEKRARIKQASASANNILIDVIQKAKRVSTYVTNPLAWKERLTLATMTPIELARKHLLETGNKPKV
jgi:hypothetical protein